ncbi:MAG: response regulator receiver [Gemmatimonadetes bacterium]|nr:response regulator receiver [Gemmatimonadota bacterium]
MSTILLVEDNEDNRIIYATMLRHAGYTVLEAHDGQQGVDLALEHRPDLILMDISIPILDGYEATKLIKENEATSRIPVLALTAHALAEDRQRVMAAGFDGYFAKPLEPRTLLQEVQARLGPATMA